MSNGETSTRYHGEIKVTIGGNEARVNIFADTLAELFRDLGQVHAQFGNADPITNPAKREIVNAQNIAAQMNKAEPKPSPRKAGLEGSLVGDDEIPVCQHCGSDEFMELIEFTDKETGKLRKAWKCQQCKEWHWPNGKGKGKGQ